MTEFTVYTRRGCHLCEVLIEELMPLVRGRARVHLRDVDTSPELARRYGLRIPVLEAGGKVLCEYRLDREQVLRCLDAASDDPDPAATGHP